MATVTVSNIKINKKAGTVTIPLSVYLRFLMIPSYQLKGKAAHDLDNLVEEGMREYKAGKTRKLRSLADLD